MIIKKKIDLRNKVGKMLHNQVNQISVYNDCKYLLDVGETLSAFSPLGCCSVGSLAS